MVERRGLRGWGVTMRGETEAPGPSCRVPIIGALGHVRRRVIFGDWVILRGGVEGLGSFWRDGPLVWAGLSAGKHIV